jgi:hypothetical protein
MSRIDDDLQPLHRGSTAARDTHHHEFGYPIVRPIDRTPVDGLDSGPVDASDME